MCRRSFSGSNGLDRWRWKPAACARAASFTEAKPGSASAGSASGAAGRKSLAFALRYRAPDRTLEEDEVARVHGAVEQAVQSRLGAEVRGR